MPYYYRDANAFYQDSENDSRFGGVLLPFVGGLLVGGLFAPSFKGGQSGPQPMPYYQYPPMSQPMPPQMVYIPSQPMPMNPYTQTTIYQEPIQNEVNYIYPNNNNSMHGSLMHYPSYVGPFINQSW